MSVLNETGQETRHPGMCDTVMVQSKDSVRIVTTGGGGWGDPLKREIDKVVYDLQCGLISEDAAREQYGVVVQLEGRKWIADKDETSSLREKMSKLNANLPMFDRGEEFKRIKEKGVIKYPENWTDPDEGWYLS